MGYNIIDLINKSINIAIRKKAIYESIGQIKCDIPFIETMSKVLAREISNSINYYEEFKSAVSESNTEEIDFYIYDKMSFLIDEFNKKICATDINNIKEYLKFSLNLERDAKSLLIDIQGRFLRDASDTNTKTYKTLSDMIINKEKLVTSLEKIVK
ncbi:hypothetical protein [Clostridium estertheticum]|uniref:hypothetical protein n=1 Tax=Clostridium estertheticum TaxID=238834 RepID=UPI001C6E9BAF|nr:hypothetical protein [Clostridium estertheticum]MBW9154555.1 hypothetical protein [Clostridium estertheticum]WLC83575.1 hypothetical protein KTC97_16100 [Clostridium estertheticum]